MQSTDNAEATYLTAKPYDAAISATAYAASAVGSGSRTRIHESYHENWIAQRDDHEERQAALLRHIFGNPFRPYSPPTNWQYTVVQLAFAFYNGQDCGFALHDALLDAGHSGLADHFRHEDLYPKGCWPVDLILGKQ